MVSLRSFFRNTPASGLREYFSRAKVELPEGIDWSQSPSDLARSLDEAVEKMGEGLQSRIFADAERIVEMSNESGQTALYGVTQDRSSLDKLPNGHARSIAIFINDPKSFRRAEEVRYTDEHRRGRDWDGFVGPQQIQPRTDAAAIDRLKTLIHERFASPNVDVDVFMRSKPRHGAENYSLLQVTVYRDGRPDEVLEFVEGALDRRPRRPVHEAAITYESVSGAIEVVAEDRESRTDLARFFVAELLGRRFANKSLPLRRYDLGILLRPHQFPTDPEDRIESVYVKELRIAPVDSNGERITLECTNKSARTIWQMTQNQFGLCNPLHGGWYITRAKLTIAFHPEAGTRMGRRVPVALKAPHSCDLKDCTENERMIGEKYLQRWSLLKDV
jgi:hypothetical protein